MMGQLPRMESLFYYFRLEDQIPEDHLLPQEPAEFPEGSRGAIESAGEEMALLLFGF